MMLSGRGLVVADHLLSAFLVVENASGSLVYELDLPWDVALFGDDDQRRSLKLGEVDRDRLVRRRPGSVVHGLDHT